MFRYPLRKFGEFPHNVIRRIGTFATANPCMKPCWSPHSLSRPLRRRNPLILPTYNEQCLSKYFRSSRNYCFVDASFDRLKNGVAGLGCVMKKRNNIPRFEGCQVFDSNIIDNNIAELYCIGCVLQHVPDDRVTCIFNDCQGAIYMLQKAIENPQSVFCKPWTAKLGILCHVVNQIKRRQHKTIIMHVPNRKKVFESRNKWSDFIRLADRRARHHRLQTTSN